MDAIESLSPTAIDREIAELTERINRLNRLRKLIGGPSTRKPRTPRTEAPGQAAAPVDRSLSPRQRVLTFLQVNGPSTYHQLLKGCALMPAQLSEAIKQAGIKKEGAEFKLTAGA
jgi:hypothetical protein